MIPHQDASAHLLTSEARAEHAAQHARQTAAGWVAAAGIDDFYEAGDGRSSTEAAECLEQAARQLRHAAQLHRRQQGRLIAASRRRASTAPVRVPCELFPGESCIACGPDRELLLQATA